MTQMRFQQAPPRAIVAGVLSLIFAVTVVSYQNADDGELSESEKLVSEEIKSLKNSEIDWKGAGFATAGPAVAGANAKHVEEFDVKAAERLIALLDNPDSFVVAHVLLTRCWRIPAKDKEHSSIPISTGFVVGYNGLIVKIDWKDVAGKATKTVTIPDLDLQQKRIAYWWKSRYRDFPKEFSPKTLVE